MSTHSHRPEHDGFIVWGLDGVEPAGDAPEEQPAVPILDGLDNPHAVAQAMALRPGWLAMSPDPRSRALRIVQALAEETSLRGHDLRFRADDVLGFRITVRDDAFDFTLAEEQDLADVIPDDEVAAKKYPWQRVSPRTVHVPSGRLVLRLDRGYRHQTWADRTRWRLDDRLGDVLARIESLADQAEEARIAAKNQARQLRQAWDDAITVARERYIEDFNRARMESQLAAWEKANALRAYVAALAPVAAGETDPDRAARISDWQRWIDREGNRIDPLATSADLQFVTPEDIGATEMDPYMPKGMSAHRPPMVPD